MRKSVRAGIAAVMTAAAITVGVHAVPASAAPAACGGPQFGDPIQIGPSAQLSASTTFAHVGDTIETSGAHYLPNENVAIYISGSMTECQPTTLHNAIRVGTGHTDASGSFDPSVKVPNVSGNVTIFGIGASHKPYDYSTQPLTVAAAGGTSGGTQPPAHTGTDIALMFGVAAVLLGAGAVFTQVGRRRRTATHS